MSDLEHMRYADWDAAYVLGSLSRTEREEYEAHVADCKICRTAIGELAPLPGLLGHLDDAEGLAMLEEAPPVATVIGLSKRRFPTRWIAGGLAAAALILAAVLVPTVGSNAPPQTAAIALHQVVPSALSAHVALTRTTWGTRIDMTCAYAATYGGVDSAYRLYVVDRNGRASLVSSWRAGPGDVAKTSGSSELDPSDISAVQIRDAGGKVLLTGQA
jgi:hypothetical protein